MNIETILSPHLEKCPQISQLSDDKRQQLASIIGFVDETVGVDHLVKCLTDGTSMGGDGIIRCYVGFEPSGKAHIGWKVLALQLRRMLVLVG